MSEYLWTSEYVSPGHPDKVSDQISDAILDEHLKLDKTAKVAVETMVKGKKVFVSGEITSINNTVDIEQIIRDTIRQMGYNDNNNMFSGDNVDIILNITKQSPEINSAVDRGNIIGAGDQGMMVGYATDETPTKMPTSIFLAKNIIDIAMSDVNKKIYNPDMKSQVTLVMENGHPKFVDTVVFSACHKYEYNHTHINDYFHDIILPTLIDSLPLNIGRMFTYKTKFIINPAGAWYLGGPDADAGVTGRKIVVDQYGADCEIGGGAFSGKDASKVDRSAAYMARNIALYYLTVKNQERIKVQLSYAIGQEQPISVRIFNPITGVEFVVDELFSNSLSPGNIISELKLNNPIYLYTTKNGHFGNKTFTDANGVEYYTWEKYNV